MSKFEWDMCRDNLTPEEVTATYRRECIDLEKLMGSHERQLKSRVELERFFNKNQFFPRGGLTKEIVSGADLVISLGGDNHFQYVSHFIGCGLIMGVNSDPSRSEGALNYFTTENFEEVLKRLERDDFDVEEWTRLEARLNGSETELGTTEYFLGEAERKNMSRHILELNGSVEEQKCSGLLVVTGAGSTGWYDSACRYLYPKGNIFPKTNRAARFLVTEPYRGRLSGYSMLDGTLQDGEELVMRSFNDSNGRLSVDCLEEHEFNAGTRAVIRISDSPLKVIRM